MRRTKKPGYSSWTPYILVGIAFICAGIFGSSEIEIFRRYAAGIFGLTLGGALLLWGIIEFQDGKIKGKRGYVYRGKMPVIFFATCWEKNYSGWSYDLSRHMAYC